METNIKKIKITIDGKEIVLDRESTILSVARENNIHIPTLCHHPQLSAWGGCRLCMVEVDGSPKLTASCVTPVRDGMEIITSNQAIIESRRTILEFLFAEREHNCMFCPESGECELQSLAYELHMDHLTISSSYNKFPIDITSHYMGFDHNRCILCGRCVRACQEISGVHLLNFINRGPKSMIGFDLNETREKSTCHSCGLCMQVCPTGAIFSRYRSHYAVKGHEREKWQKIDSFCPVCGLLCPTTSTIHDNNLLKVEGHLISEADIRAGERPDGGQLCYKGRFEVLRTKGQRLTTPLVKNSNGSWEKIGWQTAVDLVSQKLSMIRNTDGGDAIFGIASTLCSNENLLLFKDLMARGWGAKYIDTFDGEHFRNILKTFGRFDGEWQTASWKMVPQADFILVVGANPYQTQPIIQSLIHRSTLEKGVEVATIGRGEPLLPFASWHLDVDRGEEPLVIKAMLKEAIRQVKEPSSIINWKRICEETEEIDSEDILKRLKFDKSAIQSFHEMSSSFARSLTPLIITGEGLTGLKEPSGLHEIVSLALLKGYLVENILRIVVLKPYGNSGGAWKLGVSSPKRASDTKSFKGGVLLMSGEEDSTDDSFAENIMAICGTNNISSLGVITPFFPDPLFLKADIVIPIPIWMEEDGTYSSLDGRETVFKKKVLTPPEGVKDTADLLLELAAKAMLKI